MLRPSYCHGCGTGVTSPVPLSFGAIVRALRLAVLSILATAAMLSGQTPPQQVLVKAGRLVDGRSQQVQTNVGILIEGERIKAVGPLAQIQGQAAGARVIDLSQMTVLPGLIDAHTHLLLQGDITSQEYEDQLLKQSTPYRAILAAQRADCAGARLHGDSGSRNRRRDVC